jgi:nickel-dependent lactate racemase
LVECWLPYGDTEVYLTVNIRDLLGIAEPINIEPHASPRELITNSFSNLKSPKKLEDLLNPDSDVCIVVDGATNSKAAVEVLSFLVDQLVNLIVPKEKITVIIANGIRERSSKNILNEIKKSENLKGVNFTEHTKSSSIFSEVGTTHQGTLVQISKTFTEAKIKIAIGETNIDNYTGFSGAHTAVIPGLASEKTIEDNRRFFFKGELKPGVIELNSIKEDIFEAVKMLNIDLAINLIVNYKGKMCGITVGSLEESWGQSIYELDASYNINVESDPDIVVISAGGNRYDFNLYNSIGALKTASKIIKKGGSIILLAECAEGLGVDAFTNMSRIEQLPEIERRYKLGAEAVYILKSTIQKAEVTLVSSLPKYIVDQLGIQVARTVNNAYEKTIENRRGKRTLIIPYGCSTYPSS